MRVEFPRRLQPAGYLLNCPWTMALILLAAYRWHRGFSPSTRVQRFQHGLIHGFGSSASNPVFLLADLLRAKTTGCRPARSKMPNLSADDEAALVRLAAALVNQQGARTIVAPQAGGSGFWFGGGNMVQAAEVSSSREPAYGPSSASKPTHWKDSRRRRSAPCSNRAIRGSSTSRIRFCTSAPTAT